MLDEHHHYYQDGHRVPGVTEIISLLAPRWDCDPWYLERGRILHLIAEYEDRNELDEATVDPALQGYLYAYRQFVGGTHPILEVIEATLYHPRYGYAGKPDRYGELLGGKSVWDLKFGQPSDADRLQVSAYLFLLKANGYPATRGFDVYLRSTGTYRVEEVTNLTGHFLRFLAGLKKWEEEHGTDRGVEPRGDAHPGTGQNDPGPRRGIQGSGE